MIKIEREVQGQAGEGCGGLKSGWEGAAQPEDPPAGLLSKPLAVFVTFLLVGWLSPPSTQRRMSCAGVF